MVNINIVVKQDNYSTGFRKKTSVKYNMLRGYGEKKGEIEMNNTMTIMGNNTTMTKCYANVGKNRTWFQRLKGYFLDNADYFATASVMLNGNAASAAQIMKNTNR